MRTVLLPTVSNESVGAFFRPLEEAIHQHFLPALTGRMPSSEVERELLSLPCRSGGLNIPNPTCCSDFQFSSSKLLSASLVAMIQQQTFTSLAFSRLVLPSISQDNKC